MTGGITLYFEKFMISWNIRKCIHRGKCLKHMFPGILESGEDCIQLPGGQKEKLMNTIALCPMQAFTIHEIQ